MTITYIVIFGLLVLILVYVIPQLGASINSLFVLLSNSVTDLVKWIKETAENWDSTPLSSYIKAEDIANYATTQLSTALNVVQDMIRNFVPLLYQVAFRFANGFINFVVGVIISIYLIYNRESAIRSLKRMTYAIFKKVLHSESSASPANPWRSFAVSSSEKRLTLSSSASSALSSCVFSVCPTLN
ncbi:MAG: AI-2E family transporter [Clostridia bacterium]